MFAHISTNILLLAMVLGYILSGVYALFLYTYWYGTPRNYPELVRQENIKPLMLLGGTFSLVWLGYRLYKDFG